MDKSKKQDTLFIILCVFMMTTAGNASADTESNASADTSQSDADSRLEEIIVTASKREESENSVGMSITAVSGSTLVDRGIDTTSDLARIVPSFRFETTTLDTPVYVLRGVGFNESSLAANPAVTVYVDEMPLVYPAETAGTLLDMERVEVLKGPQGTLFGQNATGGAVNYITNKPTDTFQTGVDASYGRFNATEVEAFVSGPLSSTLNGRLAVGATEGGAWQESYTRDASLGTQRRENLRTILAWNPIDPLKVNLTINAWYDGSDTQAGQLIAVIPNTPALGYPALDNYPLAPHDPRSADWDAGTALDRDNRFYDGSIRIDYDLNQSWKLISLSSYANERIRSTTDADGMSITDVLWRNEGSIRTFYEEIRIQGSLNEKTRAVLGVNYEDDRVFDQNTIDVSQSTTRELFGLPLDSGRNFSVQDHNALGIFTNVDRDLTDSVTIQAGARYTEDRRDYAGCSADTGNGQFAAVYNVLQGLFNAPGDFSPVQPYGCGTLNATTFQSGLVTERLDQNNVSWRADVNWKPAATTLIYGNISKGYKSGNFPTISASTSAQLEPVIQEDLLAYEIGLKQSNADHTVQFNTAAFYYDYRNKQVSGYVPDPVFGPLERLVNIPKSRISGVDGQLTWIPIRGVTLTASGTYLASKITSAFENYNPLEQQIQLQGESLPQTPKWSGTADAQYAFPLTTSLHGFIGGDVTYQSATNAAFGEVPYYDLNSYTLVDARVGVEKPDGSLRVELYGRNIGNEYYWNNVFRTLDTIIRYAGMPATYGIRVRYRFN